MFVAFMDTDNSSELSLDFFIYEYLVIDFLILKNLLNRFKNGKYI
jgi:hypothetical protein